MVEVFKNVKVDWLKHRLIFITISVLLMLAGLGSAVVRQWTPGGTEPFNQGVDFKGGTVATVRFKQRPSAEAIRDALNASGVKDAVIQHVIDKSDIALIKLPLEGESDAESQVHLDQGRARVKTALAQFGRERQPNEPAESTEWAWEIIGTDAVGAVAGAQLRNKAIAVTLAALVGILVYMAYRFEWTYGAAAVIAVFHDVLVTLGFFSIFQIEISLTVIAALLTLVGFSVNDTIVVFDRIRENRRLQRRESLYNITNNAINQTLSRTAITNGLVFLSVLAMVLFGGEVLRGFSLALLIGVIFGTYSSVAIASPIMVWWEQRLAAAEKTSATAVNLAASEASRGASRGPRTPLQTGAAKPSRGASRT